VAVLFCDHFLDTHSIIPPAIPCHWPLPPRHCPQPAPSPPPLLLKWMSRDEIFIRLVLAFPLVLNFLVRFTFSILDQFFFSEQPDSFSGRVPVWPGALSSFLLLSPRPSYFSFVSPPRPSEIPTRHLPITSPRLIVTFSPPPHLDSFFGLRLGYCPESLRLHLNPTFFRLVYLSSLAFILVLTVHIFQRS